jgi:hypothetical protein
MKRRTDREVIAWLNHEYLQPFKGWDFSYLTGRRNPLGVLPWDYRAIAAQHLPRSASLLDVDTGGGEFLFELLGGNGFVGRACAVEAYAPNVPVARRRLESLGVTVHDTSKNAPGIDDASFDLVLARHGGSLSPVEIHRILQTGGYFVTEQVGDRSNAELRELFDSDPVSRPDWPHNAQHAAQVFAEIGFASEQLAEHSYPVRFMDVGALVYYLKAVPWEVPDFSIAKHSKVLLQLHRDSSERGFVIDSTYHAFLFVGRKSPGGAHD